MENILGEFLHFRVHTDELDVNDLMTFLHEQTDIQFAVKEFGKSNREHIHACLKLKCAKQTFVDRLKKKFQVIKGNKYYGLGKLKKGYDANARYCYKGRPNDYPDILYTVHTEEQWKDYYKRYWEEYQQLHPPPPPVEDICLSLSKPKSKTFMQKLVDDIFDEYETLPNQIWSYYGYKSDELNQTSLETFKECQDYLAELLYQKLGMAVKNIDDIIFERLYRGLFAAILVRCPDKSVYKKQAQDLLNKFRHKL